MPQPTAPAAPELTPTETRDEAIQATMAWKAEQDAKGGKASPARVSGDPPPDTEGDSGTEGDETAPPPPAGALEGLVEDPDSDSKGPDDDDGSNDPPDKGEDDSGDSSAERAAAHKLAAAQRAAEADDVVALAEALGVENADKLRPFPALRRANKDADRREAKIAGQERAIVDKFGPLFQYAQAAKGGDMAAAWALQEQLTGIPREAWVKATIKGQSTVDPNVQLQRQVAALTSKLQAIEAGELQPKAPAADPDQARESAKAQALTYLEGNLPDDHPMRDRMADVYETWRKSYSKEHGAPRLSPRAAADKALKQRRRALERESWSIGDGPKPEQAARRVKGTPRAGVNQSQVRDVEQSRESIIDEIAADMRRSRGQ